MKQITIHGVKIDNITIEGAVERAIREREGVCTVVTPNAVMLEACRRDGRLAALLNRATMSLPDGIGVLLAAKKKGTPLLERVAGIEFGERLMQRAEEMGWRVFLLGGKIGVGEDAAKRLRERYPRLCICGTHHGYFDRTGAENERVIAKIRDAKTDVLFVCFGFPIQEEWMLENIKQIPNVRVAAGLGGSLDVWSGRIKRAPKLIRACRLEWAWRMLREPKRLRHLPCMVRLVFGKVR